MNKPETPLEGTDREGSFDETKEIQKGKKVILSILLLIPLLEYTLLLAGRDLVSVILWSISLFALLLFLYLGKAWPRPVLIIVFIIKSIVLFIEGFHHLRMYQDITLTSSYIVAITFILSMIHAISGFLIFSSDSVGAYVNHCKNKSIAKYIQRRLGED